MSSYDTNLDKNPANYIPLTPLTFLERAKDVYPNYEAIVYEDRSYTWSQVYKRAIKFAYNCRCRNILSSRLKISPSINLL